VTTPPASPPRAWAEIDLDALRQNFAVAREAAGGREIMAVVKAGAYGHGLETIARTLAGESLAFFGVANVGEARRIAGAGVTTPIYLLGPAWEEEREEIVHRGWTPCLSTIDEARHFGQLAARIDTRLQVQLTVDTGMGRGGFLPADLPGALDRITGFPHLEVTGIGSHLPSADEDPDFTRSQFAHFERMIADCGRENLRWRHLANSAGLLGYDQGNCNLVRPGLMLYGISPLPGFQPRLHNVMTLKSRVTLIRTLPAGHGISYGRSFLTDKPTRVATIGIGYGDGYPRHLSGHDPEVAIRGRRFPLLGRVTMDQIMVDTTAAPDIAAGDEVELFGPTIQVTEVAEKAGTIPWEVLTGITPRVTRLYRDLERQSPPARRSETETA